MLRALDLMLADTPVLADKWTFTLLLPANARSKAPIYKQIRVEEIGRNSGALWEQIDLAWHTRGELLLSLCNAAPVLKRKQAVVIHDAAPARVPESYSRKFRLWYRLLMPWLGRMAQQILTVSEFSRRELSLAYAIPPEKISVLSESGEHILRVESDEAVLDRMSLRSRPFVLGVSSMSPHKNFATLIRAVESLESACGFDVVIAGGANPRVFAAADLPPFVKYVGYVTDEELRALYEHAACFVFPSYYEGFGLPAAEAMALGCPVIAASAASIPEVCGDAAVYFDCHNPAELATILSQIVSNPEQLLQMRSRSKARALSQEWRASAAHLLDLLDGVRICTDKTVHRNCPGSIT
jgi:glycosyltransferase involved in cell wall biosynthesis